LINVFVPMMFVYGRQRGMEELSDRALGWLEKEGPEDNVILRSWKELGLKPQDARETQALLFLKKEYCDKLKCLQCSIGLSVLQIEKWVVNEEDETFFSKMLGSLDNVNLSLRR
jgi:hypothetical protein